MAAQNQPMQFLKTCQQTLLYWLPMLVEGSKCLIFKTGVGERERESVRVLKSLSRMWNSATVDLKCGTSIYQEL